MTVVTIAHNAIKARLMDAPKDVKLRVSSLLSFRVEGVEHMAAFKTGTWDGRSSFFDFRSASFPAGFVNLVHSTLTAEGMTVKVVKRALPTPLGEENPKVDSFDPDERYDYQPLTVKRLLRHGQMIAQVATGGGKSRIAKLVYATIQRTTLFLTTRSVLMYQMKDAFENGMGIQVGVIGDGEWKPRKGMNVGMVQSIAPYTQTKTLAGEIERYIVNVANAEARGLADLKAKLVKEKATLGVTSKTIALFREAQKRERLTDKQIAERVEKSVASHNAKCEKVSELLKRFEVVILEEAHEAGGNGFFDIMNKCVNAHYRLSLTATPFMRDDEESNMRLMAVSGPIGIRISEKLLIDRGILAKPIFKFIQMNDPIKEIHPNYSKVRKSTPWQRAYKLGIAENELRNDLIVKEVIRAKSHRLTTMVLVQHKAHGEALKTAMKDAGIRVVFIYGDHNQDQRQKALADLKSGKIDVLIGSTIMDVGVDVPAVGMIVLAGGGKAEVALRQRIGRGLRKKVNGPNICLVIDFTDSKNDHLRVHARQRRVIIEGTPGFFENILPTGEDFDYKALGLAA